MRSEYSSMIQLIGTITFAVLVALFFGVLWLIHYFTHIRMITLVSSVIGLFASVLITRFSWKLFFNEDGSTESLKTVALISFILIVGTMVIGFIFL